MGHTTLFVRVGRAEPKPVCSVNNDSPSFESQLRAQENKLTSELIAGGNDIARVEFTRVASKKDVAPAAIVKKGKHS